MNIENLEVLVYTTNQTNVTLVLPENGEDILKCLKGDALQVSL